MIIICNKCGYSSEPIKIDNSRWDNPNEAREGYEIISYKNIDIDSQFEFCYIECVNCGYKVVIST